MQLFHVSQGLLGRVEGGMLLYNIACLVSLRFLSERLRKLCVELLST